MRPSKAQTIQFLNNELKKRAGSGGYQVVPSQAEVNMAKVAKVKVQNATSNRPQRA